MSFSSLKKSTHTDRPKLVTIDQFIDDAVAYANGKNGKPVNHQKLKVVANSAVATPSKMKRATFTLSDAVIDGLTELAESTGIPRSRIIRILVQQQMGKTSDRNLLDCQIP